MKKKYLLLIALCLFTFALAGCGQAADSGNKEAGKENTGSSQDTGSEAAESGGTGAEDSSGENTDNADKASAANGEGLHHVEIEVENYGTIAVELDGNNAPISTENFIKLANEGFYDGLTFHRIISGFMIQGGDPLGNGTGGSEETIQGEFPSNGVDNPLEHTRGAISMARSQDNDSASSQFFIVHQDSPHLNGDYAVFGYVTDGMDIVDKICEDTTVQDQNGTVLPEDQPVIKSIKVID